MRRKKGVNALTLQAVGMVAFLQTCPFICFDGSVFVEEETRRKRKRGSNVGSLGSVMLLYLLRWHDVVSRCRDRGVVFCIMLLHAGGEARRANAGDKEETVEKGKGGDEVCDIYEEARGRLTRRRRTTTPGGAATRKARITQNNKKKKVLNHYVMLHVTWQCRRCSTHINA